MRLLSSSVLAAGLFTAGLVAAPDPRLQQAQTALERLPLRFEANQGQWDPAILYTARAAGYRLLLTEHGPSLALPGGKNVDIGLAGSNAAPQIEALDRLPVRTNYFIGRRDRWRGDIPNYARVRYRGVYPGIDAVYYGNQNELEYDFVVAPGADPRAIRFQVSGTARLVLTPEGDLAIESGGRRIVQKKPLVYQESADGSGRREVAARYTMLAGHSVGVRVGRYDPTRPLVIDPVVTYCTYFGGDGADQITAMTMGPNGQLYIAGTTDSSAQPAIGNYYSDVNNGAPNIFLAVVDTTQSSYPLTYFSYFGGTGADRALSIYVDAAGFVYLGGSTTSTDFPLAGANIEDTNDTGLLAGFVLKISTALSGAEGLWYGTYLSSLATDAQSLVTGVAADSNGLIYVIGTTRSGDFPTTESAYASVLYGSQDAFLCQIDPNAGELLYSTYLGGELDDAGVSIALDANGLVYFAINTNSTLFPAAGYQYQSTLRGHANIVVGVMDFSRSGTPSLVWDTYLGGSDTDVVLGMTMNAQGKLVLTGYTLSSNFPVTADAAQPRLAGNGDAFVAIVDANPATPAAFLVYSTYLGGSQGDVGYGVTQDSSGDLYVTGYTLSSDFPVTAGAPQTAWGKGVDVFVSKIKPGVAGQAAIEFGTYFGGQNIYTGNCIVVDASGTMYVAGYGGLGLPTSANASQLVGYGGGTSDGFLIVMPQSASGSQANTGNAIERLHSGRPRDPR
jgi:hypothetical protein